MIYFLGESHAAVHLRDAAIQKGVKVAPSIESASLIFVSEDTPTDEKGKRDLTKVRELISEAAKYDVPIVITSQVTPGFTRALKLPKVFHQAETLRIKDAMHRALYPDYIVVGCNFYQSYELLPKPYREYLEAFKCPIEMVTFEDAEFSKIAVNMTLAAQVERTNLLHEAAQKCGASWWHVKNILHLDKRIGPEAYLIPGNWQDSKHLYRDFVTLEEILAR